MKRCMVFNQLLIIEKFFDINRFVGGGKVEGFDYPSIICFHSFHKY